MSGDIYTRERVLEREITPDVERSLPGVEVLAVELLSPSRFCVYVDHPGGVDHDLCIRVTHLLERYRNDYTIDVSSPGTEPPLRKPAHFGRATGREVEVRTARAIGGKKRFRGTLVAADEGRATLVLGEKTLAIPFDEIVRGKLIDDEPEG